MRSAGFEGLQLYFNGDILLTLLPCQQGNVGKWVFQPCFCLWKIRGENHQLYHHSKYTVGLNNNLCCEELGHLAQHPHQFHIQIVLSGYGWVNSVCS